MRLPQEIYKRQADSRRTWLADWDTHVSVSNRNKIVTITTPDVISLDQEVEREIEALWKGEVARAKMDSFALVQFEGGSFPSLMDSAGNVPHSVEALAFLVTNHPDKGVSGFKSLNCKEPEDFSVKVPNLLMGTNPYSIVMLKTNSTLIPSYFPCIQPNEGGPYSLITRRDPFVLGLTIDAKKPTEKYWKADAILIMDIINDSVEALRTAFTREKSGRGHNLGALVDVHTKKQGSSYAYSATINFADIFPGASYYSAPALSKNEFFIPDPLYAVFNEYLKSGKLPSSVTQHLGHYGFNSEFHKTLLRTIAQNYCDALSAFPYERFDENGPVRITGSQKVYNIQASRALIEKNMELKIDTSRPDSSYPGIVDQRLAIRLA